MKKIIFIFLGILSIGLLLPNKVNAETNITNFEDTIKEEIKTLKGQSGTEEYIKKLNNKLSHLIILGGEPFLHPNIKKLILIA